MLALELEKAGEIIISIRNEIIHKDDSQTVLLNVPRLNADAHLKPRSS